MRLINADALVEFLLKEIIECDEEYDKYSEHTILGAGQEAELIKDKVKEMPTVDIVRCKDCKYWQTSKIKGGRDYHTCMCVRFGKEGIIAFADDFCSRGVKK